MEKELAKTYDPKGIEERLYKKWLDRGYFHAKIDPKKKPFTIVMPPPNVTGQLHMGHALDNTIQDIIVRFKRMQGYCTLWQPGTDHAAIATEVRVTNMLKEKGLDKQEMGREKFLEHAWAWKNEYGSRIINQLHKLGASADWDRERFTMDEGSNRAVEEAFVRLYEKGWIYKGNRIINWCPVCKTSLSDAEVEHEEKDGFFWHIKYPVENEDGQYVEVATTRPETMLGDTAVAVNPNDERYSHLIGKTLKLPLTDRTIPVIADEYVDKEFGTGCVKITPAHDPNDFEVGKRHGLAEINIMNDDATINANGGRFEGMDRYEAREAVVAELKEQGLLVKVVPHTHAVGTHDRCHTTVEPLIKPQWFVRMKEMAEAAIETLKKGDLRFVPERFDKIYLHWLENIKDWCISRQLWWGHRIPAWYCDGCGETVVQRGGAPKCCPKCGCGSLTRDEDTLDTWFSSALWPFSTLGWPDTDTPEYKYFYPTDVLVTAYDIIFFWVIRMVFSRLEHTGKTPFHHVLIHALMRDSQGRKMSKSLGNGIEPLEVVDKYGADALRMTLVTGNAPGNDMRFYWERVEASRNFANKVWNASRFIMMNLDAAKTPREMPAETLTTADRWILCKANALVENVTYNMERYELGIALSNIYDFIWEQFCDWYIEMVKPRLYSDTDETKGAALWTLKTTLNCALKLLHPFMPFITEEIYCTLNPDEESIMISPYPTSDPAMDFAAEAEQTDIIQSAVKAIRGVRTSMDVPPSKKASVYVVSEDAGVRKAFEDGKVFFATLAKAEDVFIQGDKSGIGENAVSAIIPQAELCIPLEQLVDVEKETQRLKKEEKRLEGEIARCEGMLGNERFMSKAPQSKIDEEKGKLADYRNMMEQVKSRLAQLTITGKSNA